MALYNKRALRLRIYLLAGCPANVKLRGNQFLYLLFMILSYMRRT